MFFRCDRTCPLFERIDSCRFNPMLRHIGPTIVDSHTVRVNVQYDNLDALGRAVEHLGGSVLGHGEHRLFETSCLGFGFRLPKWHYPLVCADGALSYDNYGGSWGDSADLAKLESTYAVESAAMACERLGWMYERTASGLTVYHPGGGTLSVTAGGVDASGFHGTGCHDASMSLAAAMGRATDVVVKPEYHEAQQLVRQQEA